MCWCDVLVQYVLMCWCVCMCMKKFEIHYFSFVWDICIIKHHTHHIIHITPITLHPSHHTYHIHHIRPITSHSLHRIHHVSPQKRLTFVVKFWWIFLKNKWSLLKLNEKINILFRFHIFRFISRFIRSKFCEVVIAFEFWN